MAIHSCNNSLARLAGRRHFLNARQRLKLYGSFGTSTSTEQEPQRKQQERRSSRRNEESWRRMLEALRSFVRKEGHAKVPAKYSPNPSLGYWVENMRSQYKRKQMGQQHFLTPQRVAQLEEVGMVWDVFQEAWEENFTKLKEYRARNGHCNVPIKTEGSLSVWVHAQRRLYKQGRPSSLTEDRIARLEELDFQWEYNELLWMERYRELCQYAEAHGNCLVTKNYEPNPDLGLWVDMQRQNYKKWKQGQTPTYMTQQRADLLDKIGFVWNAFDEAWNARYAELLDFVKVNGLGSKPPSKAHPSLNRWLVEQRRQFRRKQNGKSVALTDERQSKLQKLGYLID